jgi:glycosyltransferase involved in cell wall biosynthesis
MNKLFIIGNEKISRCNKKIYYSANIDFKSIIEGLSNYFQVYLLARYSVKKEIFNINIKKKKVFLAKNIFNYALNIITSLKNIKNNKYLIISITPYTFLAYLMLFFFTNQIYVYLRSNGFKEYEQILGKKWVFLYSFMFFFFLKKAKIISCEETLVKKKPFFLVNPSELNDDWFKNRKKFVSNKKIKIIYVGRIRVEKGILNFINLFTQLDKRFHLTIIGDKYDKKFNIKNINYLNFFSNIKDLIAEYDKSHILILPSYTESHPKVVYEALARLRPVIIFEDIKHITKNTNGIFVCKRNVKDFLKKLKYVMKNYKYVQKKMLKNNLPKKNFFIRQLYNILS